MKNLLNLEYFEQFPVLETQRLILRETQLKDAPSIFDIRTNAEVRKYLDTPLYTSVSEAEKRVRNIIASFARQEGINWVITIKGSDQMIGDFGFWRLIPNHARAEIGYALHPDYWGQGFMREAISTIFDWAFDQFGLHSLEANVNPENKASRALLEKLGFQQEAYFRENYYYDGKFLDSMIYGLIKGDRKGEKE